MVHLHNNNNNKNTSNNNYTSTTSTNRNILRATSHAGPCFNQRGPEPL